MKIQKYKGLRTKKTVKYCKQREYYTDRNIVKNGWDEIEGNKMTEAKLQLRYKF